MGRAGDGKPQPGAPSTGAQVDGLLRKGRRLLADLANPHVMPEREMSTEARARPESGRGPQGGKGFPEV